MDREELNRLENIGTEQLKTHNFQVYTYLCSVLKSEYIQQNKRIGDIQKKHNLNVIDMLEKGGTGVCSEVEDQILFERLSKSQIIDYLLKTHHIYTHKKIPVLIEQSAVLLKKYSEKYPAIVKIIELLNSLLNQLSEHIKEEERVIFPLILNSEKKHFDVGLVHEEAMGCIKEINRMSDNFNCPYHEKDLIRYYNLLYEFINNIYSHINIENKYIFK